MKVIKKVNLNLLLTLCVVCISMLHPMTARAEGNVPGGKGNKAIVYQQQIFENGSKEIWHVTFVAEPDSEIVGYLSTTNWVDSTDYNLNLYVVKDGNFSQISSKNISDCVGIHEMYESNGKQRWSVAVTKDGNFPLTGYMYSYGGDRYQYFTSFSGFKIFQNQESMEAYASDGSLDGMLKDELDKEWYLQDIRCVVTADDSPTSEAGEDATYITFTWLTDNLQDGDLLEIKTHNYLKKIGGDQISGFHDYITHSNNVSAYDDLFTDNEGNERASYTMSQYDATKAWFNTLDNKPLIFKSYDTDIYYFRPYRNGVYGAWCKVTMYRNPLIKGTPMIESVEMGDFDEDDDWVIDKELTEKNGGVHGVDQNGNIIYPDTDNPFEGTNVTGIFKWFFDFMKEIPSFLGDLPSLVGSIIGFLPPQILGFIALGVVVAIILRIVGR